MDLISIEDLEKVKLSHGNLFIKKNEHAKAMLIVKAGDWIPLELIAKYKKRGVQSFYFQSVTSPEKLNHYLSLLSTIEKSSSVRDSLDTCNQVILRFRESLWEKSEDESYLNWAIACQRTFLNLEEDKILNLINSNQDYFRRSLVVSSLSITFALCCGYYSFRTLKDIYNASFLLDISLWRTGPSFVQAIAVKHENKLWGNGLLYLNSHPSLQNEVANFSQHADRSYQIILNELKEKFNFEENIELVKYHHPVMNSDKNLPLDDAQMVIGLADEMIDFEEIIFCQGDFKGVLRKNLSLVKTDKIATFRRYKRVVNLIEQSLNDKVDIGKKTGS